ncbi:hypothetical protein DAEQUDRAFT_307759 [Daedalea quercina L-15889]|uniref:Wings apart-like protein C-terminal domain-containing protein n=1 Tax=Daedalea quercina L-15889 TaxID=1314783 RepID=A0A165Q3A0_9APHY|nr:hypothetical protein DAEQUDRAFT_307759 [Daedalea quercina L-15889]
MQRTYSRKGANRRNRLSERAVPVSSDSDSEPPKPPAKRQKLIANADTPSALKGQDATSSTREDGRGLLGGGKAQGIVAKGLGSTTSALDTNSGQPISSISRGTEPTKPEPRARLSRVPFTPSDALPNATTSRCRGPPSPVQGVKDPSENFDDASDQDDSAVSSTKPSTSVAKRMLQRTAIEASALSLGGPFAGLDNDEELRTTPRMAAKVKGAAANQRIISERLVAFTSGDKGSAKADDVRPARKPLVRSDTLLDTSISQRRGSPPPAKDLSNLFDFTPANDDLSLAKATSSVAKRMLRRTATESSTGGSFTGLDSHEQPYSAPRTPTKLAKTRSDSIIDLTLGSPSSRELSQKSQSLEDVSSPPQSMRSTLTATNMRTYAGKSRSFLVAIPAGGLGMSGLARSNSNTADPDGSGTYIGSQEDDFDMEESYTDRRIRWGVDNSEDDPHPWSPPPESASPSKRRGKGKQVEMPPAPLPNGMMNDLKSITELRSKGENRRFLDEVGYLFEGLDASSPLSVRRGSALEIVTKLCDLDFARKAKAADFLERTWQVLRDAGAGNGDKVMDTILAFYAALVSRDTRDLADLAGRSDFLAALYGMLDGLRRANDPLWLVACGLSDAELRRAGIQRVDKTLLTGLEKLARKKSGLFEPGETISNRLLVSTALAALPSACQDTAHASSLLHAFHHELDPLPSRLSIYESGLPILSEPSVSASVDAPGFGHADNCLRLLDSYLLGRWTNNDSSQGSSADARLDPGREDDLAAGIASLCCVCDVVARDLEHEEHFAAASRCLESALRVLISLTHADVQWCQAVLNDQLALLVTRLIVQSQQQRLQDLGNRAMKQEQGADDHAGDVITDDEHAATSLDRQCLALGLLTNLVQVSHAAKDILRTTRLNFRCAENQRELLDTLPGDSDKRKLEQLVEHARDFTNFYVDFTRRVSQVIQSQSQLQSVELEDDGQIEDLGGFAVSEDDRVGKMLSDSDGAAVANDVVSFLNSLIRTKS